MLHMFFVRATSKRCDPNILSKAVYHLCGGAAGSLGQRKNGWMPQKKRRAREGPERSVGLLSPTRDISAIAEWHTSAYS